MLIDAVGKVCIKKFFKKVLTYLKLYAKMMASKGEEMFRLINNNNNNNLNAFNMGFIFVVEKI